MSLFRRRKRDEIPSSDPPMDFLPPAVPYPHRDGDFMILGPEVFASADREVICWRGVNYVRQPAP